MNKTILQENDKTNNVIDFPTLLIHSIKVSPRVATTSLPYTECTVAQGNFDTNREAIDMIILHTEVGFKSGTRAVFARSPIVETVNAQGMKESIIDPNKGRSAHYAVNMDGTLDHFLEEYLVAYHANNYPINQRSIGIEHEDFADPFIKRTDALYETSAKLVADICKFYNIPCDTDHIKKHKDVGKKPTACPDGLDTNRIIKRAKEILTGVVTPPPQIAPINVTVQVIATAGLNVRSKPTTISEKMGLLKLGTKVLTEQVVTGQSIGGNSKWWQIKGQLAYIWDGGVKLS